MLHKTTANGGQDMTVPDKFRDVKVLIVDDHQLSIKLITKQLESMGFSRIETAVNGEDALRMLQAEPYGIVFFDLNMPVMDGFELLKTCRAMPELDKTAFITVSAEVMKDKILHVLDSGATAYLTKPVSLDNIKKQVLKTLHWLDEHG